jgi:hypothetical protein
LSVLVERRPGELLPVDNAKKTFLIMTEHGVGGRSTRSMSDAALLVYASGADPKDGALTYVVVGDSEADFNENLRVVHAANSLLFGPTPVAWLAALFGPGGIPVARP